MDFNFAFEEVESAYKPSGRIGWVAIPLMLLFGTVISVLGGTLVGGAVFHLHVLAVQTEGFAKPLLAIPIIGLPLLLGFTIGGGIYKGNCMGKNRNSLVGFFVGLLCGLIGFAVTWANGGNSYGWMFGIILFCAIALTPAGVGMAGVDDPFCEQHQRFMKFQVISTIPVASEMEALNLLDSRQFGRLETLPVTDDVLNYSRISAFYCETCMNGYLSMLTKLTVRDKKGQRDSRTRRVFSSAVIPIEIEALTTKKKEPEQLT